ncbi:MAG: hypothetical protein M3O20_01210 [Acidobacteriota bacterium]|nr:hypothetical protein [Acidobacteriota bacterium]
MSSFVSKTIDQCLIEARQMVNDSVAPFRNSDQTLVSYLNSALNAVYTIRPDAFIGNFSQGILSVTKIIQFDTTDLQTIDGGANPTPPSPATPFPLDTRQFFNPVVAYIAGRIELADDEYVDTARSSQMLASFRQQLIGA